MDEETIYRSRKRAIRSYVEYLLLEFADSYRQTDPSLPETASGKNYRAYSLLSNAGVMIDQLAGWALDHVCGVSLAGIKMLPLQPEWSHFKKGMESSEYLTVRERSDSHVHEAAGAEVYLRAPSSAEERRLILRNLVFSGAGGFPYWLREELVEALDALDHGTVMPLLHVGKKPEGWNFGLRGRGSN